MKKINAIIIVVLLVVISTIAITSSKYIYNSVWGYYLKSQDFYFESDFLELNTKNNSILKWDGNNVIVPIKNYENLNLISDFNISYKVTCEVLGDENKHATCLLNNTDKSNFEGVLSSAAKCVNNIDDTDVSKFNKTECEVAGYNWLRETITKDISFNIGLTDPTKNIDEISVKLIVESTKPYKKVLSGIFNLNKVEVDESEYITNYNNFDLYDEITIVNKINLNKCFSVKYDTKKYLIDSDNDNILKFNTDNEGKINEIDIKINKNSTSILRFYRINSESQYSFEDFELVEKICVES